MTMHNSIPERNIWSFRKQVPESIWCIDAWDSRGAVPVLAVSLPTTHYRYSEMEKQN
jgi:hypothetical protein